MNVEMQGGCFTVERDTNEEDLYHIVWHSGGRTLRITIAESDVKAIAERFIELRRERVLSEAANRSAVTETEVRAARRKKR